MIDLVATRTRDPQTRRCAALLATVIAAAIKDAATPPSKAEQRAWMNSNPLALDSIHFLFAKTSKFDLYATMLGLDPEAVRHALLTTPIDELPVGNTALYSQYSARAIRWRMQASLPAPLDDIPTWVDSQARKH